MEKLKTGTKVISIILAVIIGLACLIIDAWFVYIKLHGETKMTSVTVNMNELKLADGSTKEIIQVKHKRNKNRSGIELFEIKLNYLTNEKKDAFFSQGIQYAGNSLNSTIVWKDFDYSNCRKLGLQIQTIQAARSLKVSLEGKLLRKLLLPFYRNKKV